MQDLLQLDHVPDVEQDDEVLEHMRVQGLVPELLISILYMYIYIYLYIYIYIYYIYIYIFMVNVFLYAYLVTCAQVFCFFVIYIYT